MKNEVTKRVKKVKKNHENKNQEIETVFCYLVVFFFSPIIGWRGPSDQLWVFIFLKDI
jgi:hypothetical protein